MNIIENRALMRPLDTTITYTNITYANLVMMSVISIFLPYVIAGSFLITLAIYLLMNKQTRKLVLVHKYSRYLLGFSGFYMLVSYAYGNWFGVFAGMAVALGIVIGFFQYSVMTKELFEKVLTLICILSIISTTCALSEKIIISRLDQYYSYDRISAMFYHPNYFGTITATVIIICAYKILTHQGFKGFYYIIAGINIINIYLCESMFAWVEVFVGIAILLFITKQTRMLVLWGSIGVIAGGMILIANINLIPRLSEAELTLSMRFKIWDMSLEQIKQAPVFGNGLMTYANKTLNKHNLTVHSHSIYLETLLNFGIVGTIGLLIPTLKYYFQVLKTCFKAKKSKITSLILAVTGAALVHGVTDITLLWIQTMPVFIFLMAGLGAYKTESKTAA